MSISEKVKKKIRPFSVMGIDFSKTEDGQAIGHCPFSDKPDKFYVNTTTLLWDSKSAAKSGNLQEFLNIICKRNHEEIGRKQLEKVSRDRHLPIAAFKDEVLQFGYDGRGYTMPVRDTKGNVVDVRRWKIGKPVMALPGCSTFLFGGEQLADRKRSAEDVYVCEGEWDAIALRWLMKLIGKTGIVVAVPGAGTFKLEWSPLLDRRNVFIMYDNDKAGIEGAHKVHNRLISVAKKIRHVWWRDDCPDGYDVRDWVNYGALQNDVPRKCFRKLLELTKPEPRPLMDNDDDDGEEAEASKNYKKLDSKGLYKIFSKWLKTENDEPLAITMATILANRIEGDPLWLLIVAPPGGMKSELLMSLMNVEETHHVSSLTPHALVSGMNMAGGADPSLMPQINGKSLVIKDFTAILSLHPTARDEIFGQLRDAYDGHFQKLFGNGVQRRYSSKFGILAGVTPAIDAYSSMHSGLGERFLKFRMGGGSTVVEEKARILKALNNTGNEDSMREELQEASERFLATVPDSIPGIAEGLDGRIAELGMITARLRGVVNRDKYAGGLMSNKAGYEVGTRVSKQLTKLGKGLAIYYGKPEIDEDILAIITRVALDSIPDKMEEVVRSLSRNLQSKDWAREAGVPTKSVSDSCRRISRATVFRCLQDLEMLGLIKRDPEAKGAFWDFSKGFTKLVEGSGIFHKPTKKVRRVVVRRKKR